MQHPIEQTYLASSMSFKWGKYLGMENQVCWYMLVILASWEAEAGVWQVRGLVGLHSEFEARLSKLARPCLDIQKKQGLGMYLAIG